MEEAIEAWEADGGAPAQMGYRLTAEAIVEPSVAPAGGKPVAAQKRMIGTVNQVGWAEQIKARVSAEFDRVARALESAAGKQAQQDRADTRAVIAILEDKRSEVMAKDQAGYFIHDWQELRDQVRQMIVQDSRYQAIKTNRVTMGMPGRAAQLSTAESSAPAIPQLNWIKIWILWRFLYEDSTAL